MPQMSIIVTCITLTNNRGADHMIFAIVTYIT